MGEVIAQHKEMFIYCFVCHQHVAVHPFLCAGDLLDTAVNTSNELITRPWPDLTVQIQV